MTAAQAAPAAGLSDTGLTRTSNEDAILIEPPLYAVADGMGGHRAGEIASRVAIEALVAGAPKRVDSKALGRAVRAANRAVLEASEKSRTRSGMGTTVTAVMVDGTRLVVAHVGDSRAYLLHQGRLQRITEDHSMVADLVREGRISEDEARFHPQRSVITRALGSDPNMVADIFEVDASPGDRLLLCTDGLTAMIQDDFIAEILSAERSPDAAVRRLVDAANRAGGYDNTTVVVVDIGDTPADDLEPRAGSGAAGRKVAARLLWVVAALALIGATSWGAWAYAQSKAYLIDEGGVVAVYRGVPGSFAGLALHWRVRVTRTVVERLSLPVASRLRDGLTFDSVEQALARAEELAASATPTLTAPATITATPAPPAP